MGGLVKTAGQVAALRSFDKLMKTSTEIVSVADSACDVPRVADEDGVERLKRPETMSDRDWNITRDALRPARDCPIYLQSHYRRLELAQKIAAGAGGHEAPVINFIQNNFQAPKYPVIDVTPVGKKE